MTIRIHHISLNKEQLQKIPEAERNLFVLLGHAANEVSVLSKLFHFSSSMETSPPICVHADQTQATLLGRLLTGKIYEFWSLLQSGYFATAISRDYHSALQDVTRAALDSMKKYFAQDNLIARVRNGHAFHYDVNQIANGFATLGDADPLDIYLSESNANSLYTFADTVAARSMLERIAPGEHAKAFDALIVESSRAVGWINEIVGGLMHLCLEKHLGGDLYSLGAEVIDMEGAPSSQVVRIPYFIEVQTSDGPNAEAQGEAASGKA